MVELIDTNPDCEVSEAEYLRLLGFPANYELTGRSRELADWARQWHAESGKPSVYARLTGDLDISNGRVRIEGVALSAKRLRKQLADAQAHAAMLVAVSAGEECEAKARQLWQEEKPDEYFFLEVYGSAVVEHLITTTGARFCAWADQRDMAVLPHQSPGYPGWEICDQFHLLQLIRSRNSRAIPGEIQVLETGMLKPKKSQLAIFGITRHVGKTRKLTELIPCDSCAMRSCQYRRAPHKHSRIQIEDVRRLQSRAESGSNGKTSLSPSLDFNAKYSINSRALKKWSLERLHLKHSDDRSVEARFRYEGTTCSNLGHRLEFDYHVRLSPAHEGYKIIAMNCSPAASDTGHTFMCKYISESKVLMRAIGNEKPLLGKALKEILTWKRQFSPSGCYCDPLSREHKWGLVLEVIHYGLVQHENRTMNREQGRKKFWSINYDKNL